MYYRYNCYRLYACINDADVTKYSQVIRSLCCICIHVYIAIGNICSMYTIPCVYIVVYSCIYMHIHA
jgi:hypothetical protein